MISALYKLKCYILGYIIVQCTKCQKELYIDKNNYLSKIDYYCSNTCGYSN